LEIDPGGTTRDQQFTLDVVNCLGCCALGKVMVIDGDYYVNVSASSVEGILNKYMENGG
jgi:NADH-quinone oxidoreductase subunit E